MNWDYVLTEEAKKDFKKMDGTQKQIVLAMLEKLRINPLPKFKGGYGIPLGNDTTTGNLSTYLKLKARGFGIRIVYELIEEDGISKVIVIGIREDKKVYKQAVKRIRQQKAD